MTNKADVVVIGGGAIGVCCGYYLAKAGHRVMLIERKDLASGCSGANAGLCVPSHLIPLANPGNRTLAFKSLFSSSSPFRVKLRPAPSFLAWLWLFNRSCSDWKRLSGMKALRELNFASLSLWKALVEEESLACNFQQKGWLLVYRMEKAFKNALQESTLLEAHGVRIKLMDSRATLEFCPFLREVIVGGIYFPEDAHLDSEKFVMALAKKLRDLEISIQCQTEVLGFGAGHRKINLVSTSKGDFYPERVVLATGAWSSGLARNIGLNLPLQPAKGYVVKTSLPEAFPSFPLYLTETKVAVTPQEDYLSLAGLLELVGMNLEIRRAGVAQILHSYKEYMRQGEEVKVLKVSTGLRPCTPDGLPIISRHPQLQNLILATGHGMLGITLAPVTGKLAKQLLCEEKPDIDLTHFRLSRFH